VADALSRMRLTETDFSAEAFAGEADRGDFPQDYPLSFAQIEHEQGRDNKLQQLFNKTGQTTYVKQTYHHASKSYELITKKDKIVLPKSLQKKATEWYHLHLLHPGETRLELTMRQHFEFIGLRPLAQRTCKACVVCRSLKSSNKKYGLIPPKEPECIPWHTLCVDLIGPYLFGSKDKQVKLHAMTMIDPATGWFEIVEVPNKRADEISNLLETTWLTRYPWPTQVIMDRGREFNAEVAKMLRDDYGITKKLITTRNPQANSIVERVHKVCHDMIRTRGIRNIDDLDGGDWTGVLSAVRDAVRSIVHTTTCATPTQLVFGRDAILNVSFEADWQYIKARKQKLIRQNNKRENRTRIPHNYQPGDRVMIRQDPSRKHGKDLFKGPYTVVRQNDNGTVQLTRATTGGAITQTWNIRNVDPCMA